MAIYPIQYLRAVAALMVVTHHAASQMPWLHEFFAAGYGAYGVDLFFVISGFVMVLTTHGKAITAREFIRRRIVRVVPLYWTLTMVTVVGVLIAPNLFRTTTAEPMHVLLSLLFIPHSSPSFPGFMWPVMVPGWTLNYEMWFYACFAMTLGRLWILAAGFLALFLFGLRLHASGGLAGFYTSYVILEFIAGAALARAWFAAGAPRPAWMRWRSSIGVGLGDASYSIYLTHLITLGILRAVWVRYANQSGASALGFVATSLVICSFVGWLTYRWLEAPLLKRMQTAGQKPAFFGLTTTP